MGIAINTPGQKPDLRTLIILGACALLATLLSSCSPNNTMAAFPSKGGPMSPYAGAVTVNSARTNHKNGYAFPQGRSETDFKNRSLKRK
jgi:hypothetical protein